MGLHLRRTRRRWCCNSGRCCGWRGKFLHELRDGQFIAPEVRNFLVIVCTLESRAPRVEEAPIHGVIDTLPSQLHTNWATTTPMCGPPMFLTLKHVWPKRRRGGVHLRKRGRTRGRQLGWSKGLHLRGCGVIRLYRGLHVNMHLNWLSWGCWR